MPVYQTNVWVCEICGKILSTTEETSPYSDPVVVPPDDVQWEYVGEHPNEKLACPECYAKSVDGCHCTRDHDFRDYDYICEECGSSITRPKGK